MVGFTIALIAECNATEVNNEVYTVDSEKRRIDGTHPLSKRIDDILFQIAACLMRIGVPFPIEEYPCTWGGVFQPTPAAAVVDI